MKDIKRERTFPDIGKRIKKIIEFRKLTQKEFSNSLGVAQNTISQLINESSNPSRLLIKAMSCLYSINEKWLLTGEGPMERRAGNGNGIAEEVGKDPKLNDIFKILKEDREARDAVYELLVGKKQVERVAKILKKLMAQKIEDLMKADLKEDPMLVDITRILAANSSTKHMIYQLLQADVDLDRGLKIYRSHVASKMTARVTSAEPRAQP